MNIVIGNLKNLLNERKNIYSKIAYGYFPLCSMIVENNIGGICYEKSR